MEEADAVHRRVIPISRSNATASEEIGLDVKKNSKPKGEKPEGSDSNFNNGSLWSVDNIQMDSDNEKNNQENSYGFDWLFCKRFYRLHGLLFLNVFSLSTMSFMFLLGLSLLYEYLAYQVGLIASGFYLVLGEKDWDGFKRQTFNSVLLIVAVSLTKSTRDYVKSVLAITWRQLLTKAVQRIYFSNIHYYQLNILDKSIDNPDQRLTQDISKLCSTYGDLLPQLIVSPFVIGYYCHQGLQRSGWQGPVGCFIFFLIATAVNKLLMTPIVKYFIKQEKCEGDFRFIHMLIRVHSESVAFHNASFLEGSKANKSLDELIKTQQNLYFRQYFLNFSVGMFEYLGSILSYMMLAIPIFSGTYDDKSPAELSVLISQNAFILIYLIFTFTSIVNLSSKFPDIAGVVHRICHLIERMNALAIFWNDLFPPEVVYIDSIHLYEKYNKWRRNPDNGNRDNNLQTGDHGSLALPWKNLPIWILRNVSLAAPDMNTYLIENLSLDFRIGESVLIVGNSSAGKSSLLRMLRGLWPHSTGTIQRHYPPGPQGVFYCPQKSYLSWGTLREQVSFPLGVYKPQKSEDETIKRYMKLLKIESILTRIGGLDVAVPWNIYDSLSPGEMQRLCFLRVFYHKPAVAVLDEATSALPLNMEDTVYKECLKLNITLISVGHRESLRQYHQKVLALHQGGGWSVENVIH